MTFSEALIQLKIGHKLRRKPWPPGQYVKADLAGYITFRERHKEAGFIFSRYVAHISDVDLFATDWELCG